MMAGGFHDVPLVDSIVAIFGMIVITMLLVAVIWPSSSERFLRIMCLVAAASLLILVIEHS